MELKLLIRKQAIILDYPGWFNVIKRAFKVEQGSRSHQIDVIWEEDPPLLALKVEEGAIIQGM